MKNVIIFIIIFAAIILLTYLMKRKAGVTNNNQYDERQSLIRGKAYRISAMTMIVAGIVYFIITGFLEQMVMEDGVAALFIACLGITAFSVYAILHDCFFGFNNKMQGYMHPVYYMVILLIVVICDGYTAVNALINHTLVNNGILTHQCVGLALAATFLIVLITMIIKYISDKKRSQEKA